jgi:hypothetical protein
MFPVIPRTRQIETQPKAEMNFIFGAISELLADYNLTCPAYNFYIQQRKIFTCAISMFGFDRSWEHLWDAVSE